VMPPGGRRRILFVPDFNKWWRSRNPQGNPVPVAASGARSATQEQGVT
jgi:hypothetical protein